MDCQSVLKLLRKDNLNKLISAHLDHSCHGGGLMSFIRQDIPFHLPAMIKKQI